MDSRQLAWVGTALKSGQRKDEVTVAHELTREYPLPMSRNADIRTLPES